MEKPLLAIALLLMLSAPVYAESARDICMEEAQDAGLTEQEEINFYVNECVAQLSQEIEGEKIEDERLESEGEPDRNSDEEESPRTAEL